MGGRKVDAAAGGLGVAVEGFAKFGGQRAEVERVYRVVQRALQRRHINA